MIKKIIEPRFSDTDALGHINNTVLPVWFSEARIPIARWFSSEDSPKDISLILKKIEIDYMAEIFYGKDVEILTYLSKIGKSSMVVTHEAWQDEKCCAKGNCVIVHFDHCTKISKEIPADIRETLNKHLVE